MSAFVPCPDVAEFSVVQQLFGQNVINNFHIKKEGGWTSTTMGEMCVALISGYNDHIADNQSTSLQYIIVRARDLSTEAGAVAEINFPPLSGGNSPIRSYPGNVAVCVSHKTGVAGKSFRGRTYFAGYPQTAGGGNTINSDEVTSWLNGVDALDAAITTAGGTWGVLSRYHGYTQTAPKYKKVPTPRSEGIFTDIINHSMDNRLDSQRRRLTGRGG
jgi:hypothetical protein